MTINFDNPSPCLFQKNSVFLSGTTKSTALKVVACAVIIGACGGSIYLIVSGLPFPSAKSICGVVLVGGVIGGSVGGVVWYRYKVKQVQKAAHEFFDCLLQNPDKIEKVQKLMKQHKVRFSNRRSLQCFLGIEYVKRIEALLNDREHFETNCTALKHLVDTHPSPFESDRYKFLAKQMKKLDEGMRNSILQHDSAEVRAFVEKMMYEIRYETKLYIPFYQQLPEVVRKSLLVSTGETCSMETPRYNESNYATQHFSRSLKETPDLRRVLEEVFDENPEKQEKLRKALVNVFQLEYISAEDVEGARPFLRTLYPFLQTSEKMQIFSPLCKRNPVFLKLWVSLVRDTKIAVEDPATFIDALLQRSEGLGKRPFFEYLNEKRERLDVKKALLAICEDIIEPTPFSLFVHLNHEGLSDVERKHVQRLSILELGDLTELDSRFLQIWLETKSSTTSIPKLCLEYITTEPETAKIKAFLEGLSADQLCEWLQSDERKTVDFRGFRLTESENLIWKLSFRKTNVMTNVMTNFGMGRHSRPMALAASFRAGYAEGAIQLLKKKNLSYLVARIDLLMLWEKVTEVGDHEAKLKWMVDLYQWAEENSEPDRKNLEQLVYFQTGMDGCDYAKGMNVQFSKRLGATEGTQASEEKPPETTKEMVFAAIEKLGLDPTVPHTKKEFRLLLLKTHPDKNPDNKEEAKKRFQVIQPLVRMVLDFMGEKEESPVRGSSN